MNEIEGRVLIQAPRGRDAQVMDRLLREAGTPCAICTGLVDLRAQLEVGASGILITEEALVGEGLSALFSWFDDQPAWSDLATIVLATKQSGRRSAQAAALLGLLGNVTLVERPVNAETLVSAVSALLRGRRRQYEARSLLKTQEQTACALQKLNETLELRVEERARELEGTRETLAFTLQSAGMASWAWDLKTGRVSRSVGHDALFGYAAPLEDFNRDTFFAHIVDEDRPLVNASIERAKAAGSLELECRIRTAEGDERWIVSKGRTTYDDDGRPIQIAGVVMDVTDRRRTEDALHQSQKMEAIGQLTGGVAHDFNNLLTVIVGGLDIIIRKPDQPERVGRLAEAAMNAARRGEQLTQQLLAFSRRQMLRPETVNPNRVLLDFHGLAQRAVGETISLELDLDPGIDPIRVDPAQFESAVLNLVVNARDAMPDGGRVLVQSRNVERDYVAGSEHAEASGPHVEISVTDTGTGIDVKTLKRAFEPFFTTKEVGKGSGLGLAQVYGFARSAGGEVTIESTPGSGTVVHLYFPRSQEEAQNRDEPVENMTLRRAANGETILLVEDDRQVLDMASESLRELDYTVVAARNAQEALDILKSDERIDILFSDVVMPGGLNGAQLAVLARRLRPSLKILLTSGYVDVADDDQIVGEGLPLLNKPYRRDELAQKLRMVLGSSGDRALG